MASDYRSTCTAEIVKRTAVSKLDKHEKAEQRNQPPTISASHCVVFPERSGMPAGAMQILLR
jgi:hypothetical protein